MQKTLTYLEELLAQSPEILLLLGLVTVLFIVIVFLGLPYLHKHVEELKLGNNEIKFRPYPPEGLAKNQDILEEIRSFIISNKNDGYENQEVIDNIEALLFRHFASTKYELFWHAIHLQHLILVLQKDEKANKAKNFEKAQQDKYKHLEHIIFKCLAINRTIKEFKVSIEERKEYFGAVEKIEIDKNVLDFWERIPKKYRQHSSEELDKLL